MRQLQLPALRGLHFLGQWRVDLEYADDAHFGSDAVELAPELPEWLDGGGLHRDGVCEWRSLWSVCSGAAAFGGKPGRYAHVQRGYVYREGPQCQSLGTAAFLGS